MREAHALPVDPAPGRLVCIGLGYSARVFAGLLLRDGFAVTGTARSAAGASAIGRLGYRGVVFDGLSRSEELAAAIVDATHVLLSVPPDSEGDPVLRCHERDFLGAKALRWVGYLSTIGVYGDQAGRWVSELSAAVPSSSRGLRRKLAEEAWLGLGKRGGLRVEAFRLPGIYGPGRSAIDQLRAGTARRIAKPGQVFNRIHVDDIAAALRASIVRPPAHQIYNLTDDEPASSSDVVTYAAGLLGMAPPPLVALEDAQLSAMGQSFYAETKRVDNSRMKSALGVVLRYPTYREGLQGIVNMPG